MISGSSTPLSHEAVWASGRRGAGIVSVQRKNRTDRPLSEVLCETQASHRLPVFTSRTVIIISPGVYEDQREVHRISCGMGAQKR